MTFFSGKNNGARAGRVPGNDEDDGDYATLRELPLPPSSTTTDTGDDTASEEGKVSRRQCFLNRAILIRF